MEKGIAYICEDTREYTLHRGDILILRKGVVHRGFAKSEGETSFYWVHFSSPPSFEFSSFTATDLSMLIILFRQLLHFSNTPGYTENTLDISLELIFCELERQKSFANGKTPALIINIYEYIRTNSDKAITVDLISDIFGYNKDYITRVFKEHIGQSLKQLIDNERIKYIKSLLLTSPLSLKETAYHAGFESYSSFLKFFRYHEGTTPTGYKNLFSATHNNNK